MNDDNSIEIYIEAIDEASSTFQTVAEEAAQMAEQLATVAEGINESLTGVDTSVTEMAELFAGATTGMEREMTDLEEVFSLASDAIDEDMIAIGTSFDEILQTVREDALGSEEAVTGIEESFAGLGEALQNGAAIGALLFIHQELQQLAQDATTEIKSAYTATGTWNETILVLQKELQNIGSSIPVSQLESFSQQMQNTTLFQQQQTLGAVAQVMAYKDLAPNYQQITELAADLATKQATLTGGTPNLSNAMRVLSDALENPVNAMSRLQSIGIVLPPTLQTALEHTAKLGDTAATSATLIGYLNSQVGGLAQQANNASGTGFTKLTNDFETMQQQMPGLTQDLDDLAKTLDNILKPIAAFTEAHPEMTANILLTVAAVLSFLSALTGLLVTIKLVTLGWAPLLEIVEVAGDIFLGIIGAVFTPFVAAAVGIGLAVTFLALLIINNWGTISTTTKAVWNDLKSFFSSLWGDIENIFIDSIDGLIGLINKFITSIDDMINSLKKVPGLGSAIPSIGIPLIPLIQHVDDAIIAPGGNILTTNPKDYLIATQTPGTLLGGASAAGSGQNIIVNINGAVWSTKDQATMLGNEIARAVNRQIRLTSFR